MVCKVAGKPPEEERAVDLQVLGGQRLEIRRPVYNLAEDYEPLKVQSRNSRPDGRRRPGARNRVLPRLSLRGVRYTEVEQQNPNGANRLGNHRAPGYAQGLHGVRKKKVQPWADLAGAYGLGIFDFPGAPARNYETFFGLYLLTQRTELRRGYQVLDAARSAIVETFFQGTLPDRYYRSMYDTPEEAEFHIAFDATLSRSNGEP